MEAIIKNGQIKLPNNILKKAKLTEKGKCEIKIINEEIIIRKKPQKAKKILSILQSSPYEQSIKNIVKASELNND